MGWGRLATIMGSGWSIFAFWPFEQAAFAILPVLLFATFLFLVAQSVNLSRRIAHLERLLMVNNEEMAFASHQFQSFYGGDEFLPPNHPYAQDLDVFGRASLYQYLNRSAGHNGRQTLAQWLLSPASAAELQERQVAVQALANQTAWRQNLQATGMAAPLSAVSSQRLNEFLGKGEDRFFKIPVWAFIRWIGPMISITVVALYAVGTLSNSRFSLILVLLFLITGYISKKATPAYLALGKISDEVNTLGESLAVIEQLPVQTPWLTQRQTALGSGKQSASTIIRQLNGILNRLEYRLNPLLFAPLNILLYWDLQQMLTFEAWKARHHHSLTNWLQVLGDIEALSSLSTLAFNHPQWAFPTPAEAPGQFIATQLGHPLLPAAKMVTSDFSTRDLGQISLITGSNMAGKSTFLRSIGLALVMGQSGASVCAASATLSHMAVMSSMRIADNLEESTSTFYAELKKLKAIIDAVNAGEPVFLLLDEILRGTNSADRHAGSTALVKQLIRQHAVGVLATHDLALADLSTTYPTALHNYHFDVQVAGDELYFDYRLKEGVCKSLNALVLMKKIGIDNC